MNNTGPSTESPNEPMAPRASAGQTGAGSSPVPLRRVALRHPAEGSDALDRGSRHLATL
jgi:hypothetical protein